jgi:hypothetical protein
MAGIFINYRRDDAPGVAGRLFDHLAPKFSRNRLFMDVDAMKPGRDFVEQLDTQVSQCNVLLAIIGHHWLDAKDHDGNRRLDSEGDYVRIELASALKRDIPVIPVLVDGALMPSQDSLPADLKPLTRRHALELRHTRFNADADAIMNALEELVPARGVSWRLAIPVAIAAATVVAVVAFWPKLSAMLWPVTPPAPLTSVSEKPAASHPAVTQNPPAPVQASPKAGPPNAPVGAPRNKNPVDGGMPVTIGDTYEVISASYKTDQQPATSPWNRQNKWLYLKDQGIEFFFDNAGRIESIHLVDPWAGSIHGVKLGDSADRVKSLLGEPTKSDERFGGDTLALTYRWPYTLTVEFHVKRSSNKVEIIMLN